MKILNCFVFSVLDYGCESWTWNSPMRRDVRSRDQVSVSRPSRPHFHGLGLGLGLVGPGLGLGLGLVGSGLGLGLGLVG